MSLAQEALVLSDRFLDRQNPDSIDRQDRLLSCCALVLIFHAMLSIALVTMAKLEQTRVTHQGQDVEIELLIAPKADSKPASPIPPPLGLLNGNERAGGRGSAPERTKATGEPKTPKISRPEQPIKKQIRAQEPPKVANAIEFIPNSTPAISSEQQQQKRGPQEQVHDNNFLPHQAIGINIGSSTSPATNSTNTGVGVSEEKADGLGLGRGKGTGVGAGDGHENSNVGTDPVAILPPTRAVSPTINIAPYRNRLLVKIAEVWHSRPQDRVIVLLTISQDGALLDSYITERSSDKAAKSVMRALNSIEFEPLPEDFRGPSMQFKLTLERT